MFALLILNSVNSFWINGCNYWWTYDLICDYNCMIPDAGYDYDDCQSECSSTCSQSMLSNNICDQGCLTPACIFDNQNCFSEYCAAGCTYSMLGDGTYNIECDNFDCYYDLGDTVLVDSPDIYVKNVVGSLETGTVSDPYRKLLDALANVRYRKTNIFILDEVLELNSDYNSNLNPLEKRTYREIYIQPKFCLAAEGNCLAQGTEVWINLGSSFSFFAVYGKVFIKNVNFYHKYSFFDCPLCDYCMYYKEVDGLLYDDRNNFIPFDQKFGYKFECGNYHSFSFFYILYGGELYLEVNYMQEVNFVNMRMEYASLFYIIKASVFLKKVNFHNIVPFENKAIVTSTMSSTEDQVFEYDEGTISFLNNGFEVQPDRGLGGFINIHGFSSVVLKNLIFEHNLVNKVGAHLISFTFISKLLVENCIFRFNYASESIINYVTKSSSQNSPGDNLIDAIIKDCSFLNNTVKGVLSFELEGNAKQIELNGNDYSFNLYQNSLLRFERASIMTTAYKQGLNSDLPMSINIYNEKIESNSGKNLIYMDNQANIINSNLELTNNADLNAESTTFKEIKLQTDAYLILTPSFVNQNTEVFISISNSYNTKIENLILSNLVQSLITISSVSGITLNKIKIKDSKILSTNPFIKISFLEILSLLDIEISNSESQGNILMSIESNQDSSVFNLESFTLQSCLGGVNVFSPGTISIITAKILNSKSSNLAALNVKLKTKANLLIKDSEFKNNENPSLIVSAAASLGVKVEIDNIIVEDNSYSQSGLIFDPTVSFDVDGNFIKNSYFANNEGTILTSASNKGLISMISNQFLNNSNIANPCITISGSSNWIFQDSKFTQNNFPKLISLLLTSLTASLKTASCIFSQNTGICLDIKHSTYIDDSSEFSDNTNTYASVMQISDSSSASLQDSLIQNNFADEAGTIYISWKSKIHAINMKFTQNTVGTKGGVIFCEQDGSFYIENCDFYKNKAEIGSAIFMQHSDSKLSSVVLCNFYENTSGSGTISLLESKLEIINSNIYRNKGKINPGLEFMFGSLAFINGSKIYDQSGEGSHLSVESKSKVFIFDSVFSLSKRDSSGYIASSIKIFGSQFVSRKSKFMNSSFEIGPYLSCAKSICEFYESSFENLSLGSLGKIVWVEGSGSTKFVKTSFRNFVGNAVYLAQDSNCSIIGSEFFNGSSQSGAGVLCESCLQVKISSSNFSHLSSNSTGGSVSITSKSSYTHSINSSNFSTSRSSLGGSVFIKDSSVTLSNNTFKSNSAYQGGSIYSSSTSSYVLNFSKNSFVSNSASQSGGGVQWFGSSPIFSENDFKGNKAFYGSNFASFAYKLDFLDSKRKLKEFELTPGQVFNSSIVLAVFDHYDQVVLNENSVQVQLFSANSSNFSLSGDTSFTSLHGIVDLTSFTVFGTPGKESYIEARTNFEFDNNNDFNLQINVFLRKCVKGEKLELGIACRVCEKNSYNLKAGHECLTCPTGAICKGGSSIIASSGYWRNDENSDVFFKCPNSNACIEEDEKTIGKNCKEGYCGNLCQSCSDGFSRAATNECSKCLDQKKNTGLIIGLCFVAIFVLIVITSSNINGAFKEQSITSIYFKILLNYIQVVALTISFNLSWPYLVRKMFEVQGKTAGSSDQFLSVDCFLQGKFKAFYAKLIILALIPVICFVFSIMFWALWRKLKNCQHVKEKLIGSIVVQLFFFQPTIIKYNFSLFNCTEITTGDYYVTDDMSIKCWDQSHRFYALCVAVPSIVVWCIGFPLILVYFLYKNRQDLADISEKLKYGFLYKGFKSNQFYWEFVIMLKKMLIISSSVFLKNLSITVQALVAFMIILVGYIAHSKIEPYTVHQLNVMELRSIVVSAITIYSGLFFLTGDLTNEIKMVLFVTMVITNILFLSYWIYYTFGYYIGKVYLRIGCCKKLFRGKLDVWAAKVVPDFVNTTATKNTQGNISFFEENSMKIEGKLK